MKIFFLITSAFIFINILIAEPNEKPNILWVTIEDTSPQFIGCYGNSEVKTPVIDRLASTGVRFSSAFATGAVCSSSRSTIITGLSTEAMGTGHHRSQYAIPDFIKGFPYYLRKAGYYTTNNSKTDYNVANAKSFIAEAWDESSSKAGWWGRKPGQPFFAVFNFNTSHQSRTMTNPWSWYEENILGKLELNEQTLPEAITMPPFYNDTKEMRKHFSRVHNSINLTDIEIGVLLEMLNMDSLKAETIVFFYADHGEGIPRGKTNPIGLGYRVPFVVWFPEKYMHLNPWGANVVTNELVSFEDLAPTILSLAGVSAPDYMKGRAFLGDARKDAPNYVYASRNRLDETPDLARSVTDGRFLYTRVFLPQYPVMKFQKYGDVSDIVHEIRNDYKLGLLNKIQSELLKERPIEYLYDLESDAWEVVNLAKNAAYYSKLRAFRKACKTHAFDVRDVHFLPEYEMAKRASGTTAYDVRMNKKEYPFRKIYRMASKVGKENARIKTQLRHLKNKDAVVRYWAAVGLSNQKTEFLRKHKHAIVAQLNSNNIPVQIELAGLLYKHFELEDARLILNKYAMSDETDIALMALQKIQYMNDVSVFEDVLVRLLEKWKPYRKRGDVYKVVCCAEVSLHYLNGRELSY